MSWLTQTLSSTLGRKLMMSLTGLFLIIFLAVHMSGNMQLLQDDGGQAFNVYAKFMTTNPIIKAASYILYAGIIAHIIYSIILTAVNRKARPEGYHYSKPSANSTWSSRNMGLLGTFIFIFLVIHLRSFWYEMHFGDMPMVKYEQVSPDTHMAVTNNDPRYAELNITAYKDLYAIVNAAFAQWWYTGLYMFFLALLGFHLAHGFASAFQTLGLNHKKYTPLIEKLGLAFAVLVPAMFATQPLFLFLKQAGIL